MTVLVISLIFAYLFVGWSRVNKALASSPLDAPLWTSQPTASRIAFNLLLWPAIQCIEIYYLVRGQWPRAIALGTTQFIIHLGAALGWIYICLWLADYWTGSLVLQVVLSAVLLVPGLFILAPLFAFASIPISLLLMWPLDLIFPAKTGPQA